VIVADSDSVELAYNDDPLERLKDDTLERAEFVGFAAEVVRRTVKRQSSAVIALIAPWGAGKSSLLKMIQEKLESKSGHDSTKSEPSVIFADFNPWMFPGLDAMYLGFMAKLTESLQIAVTKKEKLADALGGIASLAKFLNVGIDLSGGLGDISKKLRENLDEQRARVDNALLESGNKVVVIVDDLDRLHPDELLLMFKLLRLVGRFKNIYYLVSYDERTLIDVLKATDLVREDSSRANDYLEKIVQVRLDLSPLRDEQLDDAFNGRVRDFYAAYDVVSSDRDDERLDLAYNAALRDRLRTPRSLNRFFVQVDAFYAGVRGEVNAVDFLILTFLRTFEPELYVRISSSKSSLTEKLGDDVRELLFGAQEDASGKVIPESLKNSERSSGIQALMGLLFHPCRKLSGSIPGLGEESFDDIAHRLGVGHSFYFDRYFQYRVPSNDVPDRALYVEIVEAFNGDASLVNSLMDRVRSSTKPTLTKIRRMIPDIRIDRTREFVGFMAQVHRENLDPRGLRSLGSSDLVELILKDALDRADAIEFAKLFDSLSAELEYAPLLASVVMRGLQSAGENPDHEYWAIRHRDFVAQRVAQAVEPLGHRSLIGASVEEFAIFFHWCRLVNDRAPIKDWVQARIEEGRWTVDSFLAALAGQRSVYVGRASKLAIGTLSGGVIDSLVGVDFALERLDDQLQADMPNVADLEELEPTYENRRAYALSFMKQMWNG
jgi:hypothetical protein